MTLQISELFYDQFDLRTVYEYTCFIDGGIKDIIRECNSHIIYSNSVKHVKHVIASLACIDSKTAIDGIKIRTSKNITRNAKKSKVTLGVHLKAVL